MSALDHRHPSQARYRRNLRRALAVAVIVHAVLFAVVPAYTASPPRSQRDWIRMVDVRPWRSREPWPGSPGSPGAQAPVADSRVSAAPSTADAEHVRMESAAQVETTPAARPAASGARAAGGVGPGGGGGFGGGTGDGDEPPVFYAYDVAPRVIRRVEPVYPPEARDQGLEGTVVLHVNLDERGRILRAWVARADAPEVLIRAAMDAIYQFEFEPGRQKDTAVPCTVAIPFLFHLERVLDSGRK
jgi:periplasmic protein TonB